MKQSTAIICALVFVSLGLGAFIGWKACLIFAGGAGAVAATTRRRAKESVIAAEATADSAATQSTQIVKSLEDAEAKDGIDRENSEIDRIAMWDGADSGIDRPRLDD